MEGLRKKGFAGLVDPVMAYYFPTSGNSGSAIQANKWIRPPDRYLLEHGLLSAEVGFTKPRSGSVVRTTTHVSSQGTANYNFPIPLSHWRLEMILDANSKGSGQIKAWNSSISFTWDRDGSVSMSGNGINVSHKGTESTNSVQLVTRGKGWSVIINGAIVKSGEMDYQAWESFDFNGGSIVQQLRVRYLNEHSSGPLAGMPGKAQELPPKVQKAEIPEWEIALKAELKKTIEFNFEDTPVTQVVEGLNLISTVTWNLDESAMALGDLPMFMVSDGMTGEQVLNWFERLAGLSYRLEEQGVVLVWK